MVAVDTADDCLDSLVASVEVFQQIMRIISTATRRPDSRIGHSQIEWPTAPTRLAIVARHQAAALNGPRQSHGIRSGTVSHKR